MSYLLVIFLWGYDGRLTVEGYVFEDRRSCDGNIPLARAHFEERFIAARCVLAEVI